jgi:hypothetical protein
MKQALAAVLLSATLASVPLLAQEQKGIPMQKDMPMKGEGMPGEGMMMGKMKARCVKVWAE